MRRVQKTWMFAATLIIGSTVFSASPPPQRYATFMPSTFSEKGEVVLVAWNSPEGMERLARAEFKADFYQLAHHFQPQMNPLYCGIATTTIILNASRIPTGRAPSQAAFEVQKPEVWGGGRIPFQSYSQATLLNERTDMVKPRNVVNLENITGENTLDASEFDPGLTLDQLVRIQELYGLHVRSYHAKEDVKDGLDRFREAVKYVLGEKDHFVVVNFLGKTIGAATGGHISPLVAYDIRTDSVLVLDVAGHKNPWYWVPATHLYQAMHTKDGDKYRGWLVVSDPPMGGSCDEK